MSERMKKVDAELSAMREVCAALDALETDEARTRVLAAVFCLYDTETAGMALRAARRRMG